MRKFIKDRTVKHAGKQYIVTADFAKISTGWTVQAFYSCGVFSGKVDEQSGATIEEINFIDGKDIPQAAIDKIIAKFAA